MGKINYEVNPYSSVSLAHKVLWEEQVNCRGPLFYDSIESILQSTTGIFFNTGTTVEDILNELERFNLIKCIRNKDNIIESAFILKF